MKRSLRLISLVLCVALVLAVPVQAESGVSPCSSCYFQSAGITLYQVTDVAFQIWFEVVASCGTKDELGVSEIIVQKSADGTTWEKTGTYYPYSSPTMIGYDTGHHVGYVVYVGTTGYYYRACVTFYAKDDSGEGYYPLYSKVLHLQPLED